ncbi:MAG: PD40 domain-containing protein [Deltaproteobacteria bacterium]|nr:PD40 domain-containing protein [Deltaproteobacteria bacterium]
MQTSYNGLQISADGSRLAFTSTTQFTDGASFSEAVGSVGSARLYAVDLSSSTQTVRRVAQATFGLSAGKQLSLSSDGSKIFFASSSNLVGNNADGNWEIYGSDLTAATLSINQVTNTTGTTASIGFQGASMKATNDGRVYFIDSRNHTGQNGAGNVQIFSGSLSGSIAQIGNMNLTAGMTFSLSADESNISFLSARNLIGENPTLSYQAYRIDLGNGTLTQLTNFVNTANVTPDQAVFSGDGRVMYGSIAGNFTSQYGYSVIDIAAGTSAVDISTGNGSQGGIGVLFASLASALEGISGFTLTSAASARGALDSVMASIQNIASARGQLGAGAARLETASRVLTTQVQESKAANSRIVDADIASESAQLVRNQILQQSASAVLAQANQQPAITLSLLRIS